jgi:hypothetical protein
MATTQATQTTATEFVDRAYVANGATRLPRGGRVRRPANVIAAVVGLCSIAVGVWALVKTGINTDHIFTPSRDVLGVPQTPTLALGEIAFGALLLFASTWAAFGTFVIAVVGAASVAFGVIVLSDSWSGRVHTWTAADHDTGWVFILIGAVFVLAAILPMVVSTQPVPTREAETPPPELAPADVAAVSDAAAPDDRSPELAATTPEVGAATHLAEPDNANSPAR